MLMMKSLWVTLIAALLAGAGATSAIATEMEVDFGNLAPSPGGCTHTDADPGFVCTTTMQNPMGAQTFSAFGTTYAVVRPGSLPGSEQGNGITVKPNTGGLGPPFNDFNQSGIGGNLTGAGTACSDPNCELAPFQAVIVIADGTPMNDAIIGSVKPGETFDIGNNDGFFQIVTGGSCTTAGVADTCLITFPDSFMFFVMANTGNVLLTAVSGNFPSVPEPSSLALLAAALFSLGLFRARLRFGVKPCPPRGSPLLISTTVNEDKQDAPIIPPARLGYAVLPRV
jgi:hypothetical protein